MNLVILWHMHQPYYVNPQTRMALMPWVRLHAVKGYLDMIDALDATPDIHVSFNFTPVLVRQIRELVDGSVTDLWESWSRKPVEALHHEEKKRILENFFKINWDNLIKPYPRYWELLERRGFEWDEASLGETAELFHEQDWLDLQTWYNLAWTGFSAEKRYPELAEFKQQGRGFSEAQKNRVLDIHQEILRLLMPRYREAQESGRIEVTTTPFFHPIMPLVYDTDLAQRCMPGRHLPKRFSAPEDVRAQLRLAQEQHEEVFGCKARGLWPSEGSIAPELIPLFAEAGFDYFCTDEGNLFASLPHDPAWQGRAIDHLELFQGWRIECGGASVNALFRERPLSDFIGFNASRNTAERSAAYILHQFDHLNGVIPHTDSRGCLCVALDGENCWEHFTDGGQEFLERFYRELLTRQEAGRVRTRTFGEYFDEFAPEATTHTLHTGSWINSDFDIWIGDPEENTGWERIRTTRKFLTDTLEDHPEIPEETCVAAWWEIYAAEGSDWFWWYGPDFATECDFLFDDLFRTHLQNVYRILDRQPPAELDVPICLPRESIHYTRPTAHVSPPVTGRQTSYYDWLGAGELDITTQLTAMYQSDRIGRTLYFGFDDERVHLRIDATRCPNHLAVIFTQPAARRLTIRRNGSEQLAVEFARSEDGVTFETSESDGALAVWDDFLSIAVPFSALDWDGSTGDDGSFFVQVLEDDVMIERYPERGALEFPLPGPSFDSQNWFV